MKTFIEYSGQFDDNEWIKGNATPAGTTENTVSGETEIGDEDPGQQEDEKD